MTAQPSEIKSTHLHVTAHAEHDGPKTHRWILFDVDDPCEVPHLTTAHDARALAAWLLWAAEWMEDA